MRALLLAGLLSAALAVTAAAAVSPADRLLVLDERAGPYRYLDGFEPGGPRAYAAAVAAFGAPTRARADGNLCRVTWAEVGLTVGFASAPPSCTAANLRRSAWYGMTLRGRRWHTARGIRIGDSAAAVRRLYPAARLETAPGSRRLVLVERDVDEFHFVYLSVVLDPNGRVGAIDVPAGYVY